MSGWTVAVLCGLAFFAGGAVATLTIALCVVAGDDVIDLTDTPRSAP